MAYFAEKDFASFIAGEVGRLRLGWLALAGGMLDENDRAELERLLDDFFRARPHRSLRAHRAPESSHLSTQQ